MEAKARTDAHTLTQAHFQAKADARDQSQTLTTAAEGRKEVTALDDVPIE